MPNPPRRINLDEQARVGSCTTLILADSAVTAPKLADGSITTDKILDGSITGDKLDPAVAGNGLSFVSDTLAINVDNTTLQIVSDTVSTKQIILENFTGDPVAGTPGRLIWRSDLSEVRVDDGVSFLPLAGGSGGHVIQDEGVSLPARPFLDFVGSGVSVSDDSFNNKTVVSVPQGGHTIEDEGVSLPQRSVLNFIGSGVTATDFGGKTQVAISGAAVTYTKDLFTVVNPLIFSYVLSAVPVANSEVVSWNGLVLRPGLVNDYTISGSTLTLVSSISLTVGDELMVVYAQ